MVTWMPSIHLLHVQGPSAVPRGPCTRLSQAPAWLNLHKHQSPIFEYNSAATITTVSSFSYSHNYKPRGNSVSFNYDVQVWHKYYISLSVVISVKLDAFAWLQTHAHTHTHTHTHWHILTHTGKESQRRTSFSWVSVASHLSLTQSASERNTQYLRLCSCKLRSISLWTQILYSVQSWMQNKLKQDSSVFFPCKLNSELNANVSMLTWWFLKGLFSVVAG